MAAAGFLLLSEWSFTICPTAYNRKYNVLSASLNQTFPSSLVTKEVLNGYLHTVSVSRKEAGIGYKQLEYVFVRLDT